MNELDNLRQELIETRDYLIKLQASLIASNRTILELQRRLTVLEGHPSPPHSQDWSWSYNPSETQ